MALSVGGSVSRFFVQYQSPIFYEMLELLRPLGPLNR